MASPATLVRMLCLANSRKLSGRCVAGRKVVNGAPGSWIRPISDRKHQEVPWDERHYEEGSDPQVLDVVRVPLKGPQPHEFQTENWLLDPGFYWQREGRMNWSGLQAFVEPHGPLWIDGHRSGSGHNNRIPLEEAAGLRTSLNRENLERFLKSNGVRYVFLGKELGARSDDRSCYHDGRVQYARLAKTDAFRSGLERVLQGAQTLRIALMCAEKEPLECHRTLLVAQALYRKGVPVVHIHAGGHLETHDAALERLLDLAGVPHEDLFRSREQLRAEALERQEQRVAYVDEAQSASAVNEDPPS